MTEITDRAFDARSALGRAVAELEQKLPKKGLRAQGSLVAADAPVCWVEGDVCRARFVRRRPVAMGITVGDIVVMLV